MILENKIGQFFNQRLLLHIGFWIAAIIFALLGEVGVDISTINWLEILHLSVHFIGFIAAAYINLYLLIPRLLVHRNNIVYFLFVLFLAVFSTFLTQQLQILLNKYVLKIVINEDIVFLFFHISFYCVFIMMLTTLFYFLRRRMSMQEMGLKLREIEKQQVLSELKALKSQINPHFFFNALNSIYSLSLEKNPKTPEVVIKLSELMRYVLYESSAEKVPLKRELEFVSNYIELEKSRFEDSVNVRVDINDHNHMNNVVAPLIFIPFIENAFKYCNKTSVSIPEIKVSFDTSQLPVLVMIIENSKELTTKEDKTKGGVGLENVKQRLKLIYPGKHSLLIDDSKDWYRASLEIDLSLT